MDSEHFYFDQKFNKSRKNMVQPKMVQSIEVINYLCNFLSYLNIDIRYSVMVYEDFSPMLCHSWVPLHYYQAQRKLCMRASDVSTAPLSHIANQIKEKMCYKFGRPFKNMLCMMKSTCTYSMYDTYK